MEREYRDPYPWDASRFDWEMDEELRLAKAIFVGSDFVRESLINNGVPNEKIIVNPYGVDLELYQPKDPATGYHAKRHNNPNRPFRLISVGKLGLRKGTLDILAAVKQLGSSVELRLLGGNELPPHLQKQFWGENVEYMGHVPYREVSDMLRWADAYVFPTIFEGSSLASYEAMAVGLPVITTPNCGSMVRNGIDGWLIPIRSQDAICTAVTRLMEDEDLWLQMSMNAQIRAREFTWYRYGQNMVESITTAIGNR
jgi:glycosyltransferase involved in cell wall biosynthesis